MPRPTRRASALGSKGCAGSAQEVIETKRKAEPSPSGLSDSNVLWKSDGSRYSKKPKQGRSPVGTPASVSLGLSPFDLEHVHDEANALIISDEEMEAMPTTPRFCALDQCAGNGEHAGRSQEFSSDAGSPIMHHGTRMSPLPLSPLSESCGEYQNEEDFYVYEVNLFPILCWQEEPMLRHPASEDTIPIEVPRWSFWSYCRNFGSFSNQKAEDERRKLVSAMVRADRRIWNIQEIFEYDDKKGLFLGVSIFDECLIKEQPRLRPSVLAAVALGIGEKFEEADSDRDRLHLVYEELNVSATKDELAHAEIAILNAIDYRLHRPTAAHHRHWFLEHLFISYQLYTDKELLRKAYQYLCEMTLLCASSGRWAPTVQAACACHVTFVLYGERACEKHWRELLQTERRFQQLTVASRQLFKLLQEPDIRRNAIYLKYAESDQSCISVKVQEKHEKRMRTQWK